METEGSASRPVFVARLALGLVQGLLLFLLYSAFDHKAWPATQPQVFAPLAVVALFVPLLISQGLGNLRTATLAIWAAAATAIVAALAWYDVWHAWPGEVQRGILPAGIVPTGRAFFVCAVFLFVAHALVSCGDADRRIVARYTTLFDLAWKLGVQVAITLCFVAAFWIMLLLGMAMFDMIHLDGFHSFLVHPWIAIPLTTIAAAAATHVTDRSAELLRGVRTLALTLLGWLLPVIALIAFAFLISLVFTGLEPLWKTRAATTLLMAAAALLVIHINAAYQDGEHKPPHILRVAGTLASVLLIFIVWIAAYALWLRVSQYGWSVDRIYSAACVLIAGMFAVGYLVAAILPGAWLKLIEHWNVYGTILFLAVLLALSTPLADPMRLSVSSQVARLESGMVKPDKFDFSYLRWYGGRFGRDALVALGESKDEAVRDGAADAVAETLPGVAMRKHWVKAVATAITVHPPGKALPASFLNQDWTHESSPEAGNLTECIADRGVVADRCDAVLADLDGDATDEIIVISTYGTKRDDSYWSASVYKLTDNHWSSVAVITGGNCMGRRDALLTGNFKTIPPKVMMSDLSVGGRRVRVSPLEALDEECSAAGP